MSRPPHCPETNKPTQSASPTLPAWGTSIKVCPCSRWSAFYISEQTWSEKTAHHEAALGVLLCVLHSGSELHSTGVSIFCKAEKFQFNMVLFISFNFILYYSGYRLQHQINNGWSKSLSSCFFSSTSAVNFTINPFNSQVQTHILHSYTYISFLLFSLKMLNYPSYSS